MTKLNQLLTGLFALQLLLAAGIYFDNRPAADNRQAALFDGEKSRVTRITLDEGGEKQTQLNRVDGKWQLPDYHRLPADQDKVEQVLSHLTDTKTGWPTATTSSSHERFEVSDGHYQKRISLAAGEESVQRLYLGTSPGFRQLHLRRAGEDEVYAVKLNSYDFPTEPDGWLDRTLARPPGEVTGLEGVGFAIQKEGEGWRLMNGEGELVQPELDNLLTALNSLSVLGADTGPEGEADHDFRVKTATGTLRYRLFNEGDKYTLSRDDYEPAFKIGKADYDKIAGASASRLVRQQAPAGEEKPQTAEEEQARKPGSHG